MQKIENDLHFPIKEAFSVHFLSLGSSCFSFASLSVSTNAHWFRELNRERERERWRVARKKMISLPLRASSPNPRLTPSTSPTLKRFVRSFLFFHFLRKSMPFYSPLCFLDNWDKRVFCSVLSYSILLYSIGDYISEVLISSMSCYQHFCFPLENGVVLLPP